MLYIVCIPEPIRSRISLETLSEHSFIKGRSAWGKYEGARKPKVNFFPFLQPLLEQGFTANIPCKFPKCYSEIRIFVESNYSKIVNRGEAGEEADR